MNKIKQFFIAKLFFLVIIIVVVDISVNVPSIVFAETRIEGSSLVGNASWNASNSPYIIESTLTVPKGSHLTVEAGTSIVGIPEMDGYPLIYVEGELDLLGTRDHRISVSGSGGISTAGGTTTIGYSDISLSNGLDFVHSYLSFANSTISSSTYAISVETTNALIVDSNIINNNYGIYVRKPALPVFLVKGNDVMFGRGGIGNALDEANRISISNSSIVNNIQASILNETTDTVNAVENWWGTEQGPTLNGVNQIIGLVQYTPWLVSDPLKEKKSLCCSSVLFIPGLEGTRLYRQISLPLGLGNSVNRLWEPLLNINTEHLYLDANGRTQDPSIYSGGPIDIALGLKGVYGKLMNNLSDLVASGKISEWRPYGYDWRKPISEVVEGVEKKATTTDSLIATVKDMAARSMTGKVTLLAHSNGGLVSKYLVSILSDIGEADLIDKVISVAVPYLGTPQAILGLLHGSDQAIALGLVTKESVARGLGVNMSSAYSLLPSQEYFAHITGPVIAFASSTIIGINNGKYPTKVDTFSGQKSFILGLGDSRVSATSTDTRLPISGNSLLMNIAENIHKVLDPMLWPANISNWAVLGWNANTASGIKYSEKKDCTRVLFDLSCKSLPVYQKIVSKMGDGTVITSSAQYGASSTISMDLKTISSIEKMDIKHANITESSTTLRMIDRIITSDMATNTLSISSGSLPTGVSLGTVIKTSSQTVGSYLSVSTHSPVELHIYDSSGNHTGPIKPPAGLEDVYRMYETNIPGSDFTESDGSETYIDLPNDGDQYRIEVRGTGVGSFTLDIEDKAGLDTMSTVEYGSVPVTPVTVASVSIKSGANTSISNSKASLSIDIEGDGTIEKTIKPNYVFDPASYLEMYKKTISSIAGTQQKGKLILKRIDRIQELIRTGKLEKARDLSLRFDRNMSHMKVKSLDNMNRTKILDMFDVFIQQFE